MNEVLSIALRSVAIYFFVILAIRLFGKKELSQLSVIDLVFILLISNSLQSAMVGENTSLLGGVVAATALFAVNYLLKILFYKSGKLSSFFQGNPLLLIYKGKIIQKHLDEAKISLEELEAAIREHGVKDMSEVDLAMLEIDGNISVLSQDFRRRSVRKRKAHKVLTKIT